MPDMGCCQPLGNHDSGPVTGHDMPVTR